MAYNILVLVTTTTHLAETCSATAAPASTRSSSKSTQVHRLVERKHSNGHGEGGAILVEVQGLSSNTVLAHLRFHACMSTGNRSVSD